MLPRISVCRVLNLTQDGTRKPLVSFRLFTVIAALSECVVGLDASLRKCIDQLDLSQLNQKLHRARQLFYCYDADLKVFDSLLLLPS